MKPHSVGEAVRDAGLKELSCAELDKFAAYLALLLKWNSKLNLTAIREPEAIIQRHFVECIQCAQMLPNLSDGSGVLDFGSGAGLPGIPIAICRRDLRVTLAESQRKKASFLHEAVRSLGIQAEIYDGRVEQMPTERRFAIITLRAVDKMVEACRTALKRLAPGGYIVLFTTEMTESGIRLALPEFTWRAGIPVVGLTRGDMLIGQRNDVPHGTLLESA